MPTKRDYLVSKGLAKPSRGRFSREAVAELERARQSGMVFDDDEAKGAGSDEEPASLPETPYVPTRIPDKPILRNIKMVTGYTVEGHLVEQGQCVRCSEHVARCSCSGGIHPSRIIARWSDESAPYGIDLAAQA